MMILKKIPFTYHWILKNAIGNGVKTVLDIGCGEGDLMKILAYDEKWKIVGIDLYREAINKAKKTGAYNSIIQANVISFDNNIKDKKFDVVFASQVIEHLTKSEGEKVLSLWEKCAKKRIVVATTVGYTPYERIGRNSKEDNPYQKHLSGWSIKDFRKRDYKIRGQAMGFVYREKGLARITPPYLLFFWEILSYVLSPIAYFFPEFAFIMVCKKDIPMR